jgi:hypothetical protein
MSTTNEGPKALSANASSFNPPSSDQIWGAISQSYGIGGGGGSGGGTPTADTAGGGHYHHPSSHHSGSTHGTPPQGGVENNSGLGLWNFGGFGDDAKNRSAPQAGRGGMLDDSNVNLDFMGDHGNKVSILSCVCINFIGAFNLEAIRGISFE